MTLQHPLAMRPILEFDSGQPYEDTLVGLWTGPPRLGGRLRFQPPANFGGKRSQPIAVDAAGGQCQLGLKGEGCDLAVRLEGKCYFVDGVNLDQLGDAHAADGMCNGVRSASVTGRIANDRFVATTFELLAKR